MTSFAVDVLVHAIAAAAVLVVAILVAGYIKHSRAALVELIEIFKTTVEHSRVVGEADREDLRKIIRSVEVGVAGVARLEAAGIIIANDLANSHRNADEVPLTEPPGSAADAASRQSVTELGRP